MTLTDHKTGGSLCDNNCISAKMCIAVKFEPEKKLNVEQLKYLFNPKSGDHCGFGTFKNQYLVQTGGSAKDTQ